MTLNSLRYLTIGLFFIASMSACSSSKNAAPKSKVNGDWILKTITTEGVNGKFASKVFNESDYNCFIGSSWHFTSNNNGVYTLDGMSKDCPAVKRNIHWTLNEPKNAAKEFQVRRVDRQVAGEDNNFNMTIVTLADTNMQLKSDITYEGHPAAIIYNFVKK